MALLQIKTTSGQRRRRNRPAWSLGRDGDHSPSAGASETGNVTFFVTVVFLSFSS
jgi:hypothetical protein